mgnify:CR=1 FL=1
MAFTDLELVSLQEKINSFIDRIRPPKALRSKLDYGYKITNQSIEIFEIRSDMRNRIMNNSFIKTTYNRAKNIWKIYWMRADLKWHSYEPDPEAASIDNVLRIVEEDEYCCFFG